MKINHSMQAVCLIMALLLLAPQGLKAESAQTQDAKAYKQAYNLISQENWTAAAGSLGNFIANYPKSSYFDDAKFWRCYVNERLDQSLEAVFECYQAFIAAHPRSKWVNDAASNLIRIVGELVDTGSLSMEPLSGPFKKAGKMKSSWPLFQLWAK